MATNEPPHHGPVLLLDIGLVIAAASPGAGELDSMLGGPFQQGLVDEGAIVVVINVPNGKGQLPPDGYQARKDQALVPGQQGDGQFAGSSQPVQRSVTTRLWMKEPDRAGRLR